MENPKATNIRTSPTSSTVFEAGHVEQRKNVSKKSLEENISLSDEENIILAQCIKSGMPKVSLIYMHMMSRIKSTFFKADISNVRFFALGLRIILKRHLYFIIFFFFVLIVQLIPD